MENRFLPKVMSCTSFKSEISLSANESVQTEVDNSSLMTAREDIRFP